MYLVKELKILTVTLCCSLIAGCATPEGNQQAMGAGIGALLGCAAGVAIRGNAEGCAAGAAAGAAVGWGTVKVSQYNASQVRSANEDRRLYGLTRPVKDTVVKIRNGTATPARVTPGEQVKVVTDYSLQVPPSAPGSDVVESWALKKDGKLVANLPQQRVHREAGGWAADATIPVPQGAEPGTYVVETRVQAGTSYDVDQTVFVVES